jgi:hypothetical protein
VLEHVGQRLLDNTERGQVLARGNLARLAVDGQLDVKPSPPGLVRELGKIRQARCGQQIAGAFLTEHVEQPSHLGQRFPAGRLDGGERLLRFLRVVPDDEMPDTSLDRDDAHRVRDDVVQLTRYPQPLLLNGRPRISLVVLGARAHRPADRPRRTDERGHGGGLGESDRDGGEPEGCPQRVWRQQSGQGERDQHQSQRDPGWPRRLDPRDRIRRQGHGQQRVLRERDTREGEGYLRDGAGPQREQRPAASRRHCRVQVLRVVGIADDRL